MDVKTTSAMMGWTMYYELRHHSRWLNSEQNLGGPSARSFFQSKIISFFSLMSLVENYAKNNHSRYWLRFFWLAWSTIAKWLQIFFFVFSDSNFRNSRACNILLEMSWKYLSKNILHALKFCLKIMRDVHLWGRKHQTTTTKATPQ